MAEEMEEERWEKRWEEIREEQRRLSWLACCADAGVIDRVGAVAVAGVVAGVMCWRWRD